MTLLVIVYVLANKLYLKEEKIISGAIFFYCLSAVAGGVYSGNAYTKLGGNYMILATLFIFNLNRNREKLFDIRCSYCIFIPSASWNSNFYQQYYSII
jgi:drug/metabolite transporter superfamily protein YnfA